MRMRKDAWRFVAVGASLALLAAVWLVRKPSAAPKWRTGRIEKGDVSHQ